MMIASACGCEMMVGRGSVAATFREPLTCDIFRIAGCDDDVGQEFEAGDKLGLYLL